MTLRVDAGMVEMHVHGCRFVPGSELGRNRAGNDNAGRRDSERRWYGRELDDDGRRFLEFSRDVSAIRRQQRPAAPPGSGSGRITG
jgi:hypothetical protein